MTIIRDPSTSKGAEVTSRGHLRTHSITLTEERDATHDGLSFCSFISRTPTAAGDVFYYLKNLSSRDLIVYHLDIQVASAESVEVRRGDTGTPVGGTDLTPANTNAGSGEVADATSQDGVDITGLSGGVKVCELFGAATMSDHAIASGLFVPKNQTMTLYAVTGGVALKVNLWFYFHE